MSSRQTALICGAIGLGVLLAYANTLRVPFVFDDPASIADNPTIHQLSWGTLSPPHGGVTVDGRPLLNLSLALNYAWGGTDVRGYHVVNIAIHLLAALTFFGLVRRTLQRVASLSLHSIGIALAAALLWALHPLQTESVTYIVQRTESLMGLLYLFTLYAFVRGWFALAIAACALGMATKEVMVSAPLMVLLYDRTFLAGSFREAWRRRRALYLGLAASWLLLGYLVLGTGSRGGTIGASAGVTWWQYALCQSRALIHYLQLTFWPSQLVFDYGSDFVSFGEVFPYALLDLLLLGATAFALWRRPSDTAQGRPALGFLGAWFFVILAPTTSVVGGTRQMLAEHRMYLSLGAIAVLAVIVLHGLFARRSWIAWATLAVVLGLITVRRNQDYRSELSIYRDTVAKRPGNAHAHNNLGQALILAGRPAEAVEQFTTALRLSPTRAMAHNYLAGALARLGRIEESIEHARESLKLNSNYAEAHYNLGTGLLRLGQAAPAIAEFETALRLQPNYPEAHRNLGAALMLGGRSAEAIAHYEEALRLKPDYSEAHYNLGAARLQLGQLPAAIQHYEAALRLRPDYVEAHFDLGNALSASGRPADAIPHYEAAVRAVPDNPEYRNNLGGALLEGANRTVDAIAQFDAALRLRPNSAETHFNLGVARAMQGNRAEAIRHLEEAVRLKPDYAYAREELAKLRGGKM